jgi:hypothetical protein
MSTKPQPQRKPSEFEPVAFGKSMVERPISERTAPERPKVPPIDPATTLPSTGLPLVDRMTNDWWQRIGMLRAADARLDRSSRQLMMAKLPRDAVRADERARGDVVDDNSPFARTLRRFESAIAQDTARNEYLLHSQIHQWLEDDKSDQYRTDVEALNKRVYSELFLTPDHDAWLGLVPDDTYTALEKDGCACDKGALPMRQTKTSTTAQQTTDNGQLTTNNP